MPEHEFGKHEAPTGIEFQQLMRLYLKEMGIAIQATCPLGMGFALLIFDFKEGGNLFYTSNGQRDDIIKAMGEFIEKHTERG